MTRTIPAVPYVYPDQPVAAADWNDFVYACGFYTHPPAALLYQNATQVVPSATPTLVSFDSAERDSDAGHNPTANSNRYTIQIPGLYHVTAMGSIDPTNNNGGERSIGIKVNDTTFWSFHLLAPYAQGFFYGTCSADIPLNAGDWVEAHLFQDSGDNTAKTGIADSQCRLLVQWVAN